MNTPGNTPESTPKIYAHPLLEGLAKLETELKEKVDYWETENNRTKAYKERTQLDLYERQLKTLLKVIKLASPDSCSTEEQLHSETVSDLLNIHSQCNSESENLGVIATLATLLNSFHIRCSQCSNTECEERR